jgi:hypothetical protein
MRSATRATRLLSLRGAATYQPGQKPDLHALMMAADEAMYRDKQQLRAAAAAADCYSAL